MDSAMRDLEQIRERDDEGDGRPLALVALLVMVTIGLVFAMGSLVGFGDDADDTEEDPLARLDRASGLVAEDEEIEPDALPEVQRSALRFPEALGPRDGRVEAAATLAAAAAELAHPDPLVEARPAPLDLARALPGALPAAMAAEDSEDLAHAAATDPLVASSLPAPTGDTATAGHDGEYTVQVISYDSPEGAEAFAAGLRARGHHAFVMRAEVEDRGTVYRVRVGPFENLREANAYRREFERTERMNTLVVRRRDTA